MRFFSPLAMKIMGAIGGGAAAASAGGAGVHFYSQSKNKTSPSDQASAVSPILKGSLGEEQIEMAKFLWKNKMNKELIDYGNDESWIQKAKDYSVKSDKWPGDIIFITDKSDGSLAGLLRDKCYSVSRLFLNTDQTLNDSNEHLKEKFKNAKDSFSLDNLKELCSTGKEDPKQYSISSANPRTLDTLLQQNSTKYTCDSSKMPTEPTDHWMKDIYDLKKGRTASPDACTIVKGNVIIEITYGDKPNKKYEIRKSQIKGGGSSDYINVPREDWTFYSYLEGLPGFSEMFKKRNK